MSLIEYKRKFVVTVDGYEYTFKKFDDAIAFMFERNRQR